MSDEPYPGATVVEACADALLTAAADAMQRNTGEPATVNESVLLASEAISRVIGRMDKGGRG